MAISKENQSVFETLTTDQQTRILAAPTGTEMEGLVVTDRIQWELRQWILAQAEKEDEEETPQVVTPASTNAADTSALRYPLESPLDSNADYVSFTFYNYEPPFGRSVGNGAGQGTGTDTPTGGTNDTKSYNRYNQSVVSKTRNDELKPILLYMPEDVQSMYSQKWGGAEFGSVAAGLMQTTGTSGLDVFSAISENAPGVVKAAIFDNLRKATNKVTGSNISNNQFLGGVSGTILNPNTEMMYDGPNLRTFDLTFKLVAYSQKESKEIRKICNTFKKAMLPSFGGGAIFGIAANQGNLISIPNVCDVVFMRGGEKHPYLSQYKTCAISDVAVNYTADGAYATYEDGSPVATSLRISFKEMKNIFAGEIKMEGPSY